MKQVSAVLSSFEETIRENEAVVLRSSCHAKSNSKSSDRKSSSSRKSKNSCRHVNVSKNADVSTERTEELNSSSTFDPDWTTPVDDASSLGDGSFGMTNDFDFEFDDDIEWNPPTETKSESKKENKNEKSEGKSSRKKKSSSKKRHSERRSSTGGHKELDESDSCFQVTYNGDENNMTNERIRRSLNRREESIRSFASLGMGSTSEHMDDSMTFASSMRSLSGGKEENGGTSSTFTMQVNGKSTRRSSLDNSKSRSKKYGGSAGLKYGTSECEAYITSLPPAFQLSERRRLQQRELVKKDRKSRAKSSTVSEPSKD